MHAKQNHQKAQEMTSTRAEKPWNYQENQIPKVKPSFQKVTTQQFHINIIKEN